MAKKNYLHIPAIGQIDPTLCWAASLSWWLKAAKSRNISQETLRDRHFKIWNDDGTMSDQGMMDLIRDNRYGMKFHQFLNATTLTSATLQQHLDKGPVYIAYTEASSLKKHVNVIFGMREIDGTAWVAAMEPESEAKMDEFNLPSGEFTGKHEAKKLSEFNTIGTIYIGSLKN
jgi:hypothetical protein